MAEKRRRRPKFRNGLNAFQLAFIDEYLVDMKVKPAAQRARVSSATAAASYTSPYRTLANPLVRAVIQKRLDEAAERSEVTVDWVIARLKRIANADIRKVFDEYGRLKNIQDIDDETAYGIATVAVDAMAKTVHVKRHDPLPALNALARYVGLIEPMPRGGRGGGNGDEPDAEGDGPAMRIVIEGGFTDDHLLAAPVAENGEQVVIVEKEPDDVEG